MMQSSPLNLRRAIIWCGRLVIGGIFVYAGFSKLLMPNTHLWPMFVLRFSISMNISSFAQQVESYKMISPEASQVVAHTLPFVEIMLGLLLLIGWRLRIWATAITAIMVGFLAVVTRAYLLHMDINCGCFGTPGTTTRHDLRRRRRAYRSRAPHDHLRLSRSAPAAPLVRPGKGVK